MNIKPILIPIVLALAIIASCGNPENNESVDNNDVENQLVNDGDGLIPEERNAPIELGRNGDTNLQPGEVKAVSPESAQQNIRQWHVIDVRTQDAFTKAHLPGAENIDFSHISFLRNVGDLNKDKPVMVYCQDGRLSPDAASLVSLEGFPEVYVLQGGLNNWQQHELPIE